MALLYPATTVLSAMFFFAIQARRLNDAGLPRLAAVLVLIGLGFILITPALIRSEEGPNKFGPEPTLAGPIGVPEWARETDDPAPAVGDLPFSYAEPASYEDPSAT